MTKPRFLTLRLESKRPESYVEGRLGRSSSATGPLISSPATSFRYGWQGLDGCDGFDVHLKEKGLLLLDGTFPYLWAPSAPQLGRAWLNPYACSFDIRLGEGTSISLRRFFLSAADGWLNKTRSDCERDTLIVSILILEHI